MNLLVVVLLQASVILATTSLSNWNKDIFAKLFGFLDTRDVCNMKNLSNNFSKTKLPDDIIETSFISRFDPLPEHFRPSRLDKLWFLKFSTEEVDNPEFWTTVMNACGQGVNLSSCEGYAEYAGNLILKYYEQDEVTKVSLKRHEFSIYRSLVKYEKYELLVSLMKLNDENVSQSVVLSYAFNEVKHGNDVFEKVFLLIRSKDERIKVSKSLHRNFIPYIYTFFMSELYYCGY